MQWWLILGGCLLVSLFWFVWLLRNAPHRRLAEELAQLAELADANFFSLQFDVTQEALGVDRARWLVFAGPTARIGYFQLGSTEVFGVISLMEGWELFATCEDRQVTQVAVANGTALQARPYSFNEALAVHEFANAVRDLVQRSPEHG